MTTWWSTGGRLPGASHPQAEPGHSADRAHISTSYVERQNLTMRMSMRQFTWLAHSFSKEVENLQAAVALHFAHYNFVLIHKTLCVMPEMAAGVTGRLWSLEELVETSCGA